MTPPGLWPWAPRVVEKGCIASLRGPPIGGQENDRVSNRCSAPYTLLPLRGISPQGETRNLRRKTESHILHVPLRRIPPLVAVATTFPPQAGALWVLSHGAMSLQESIERFILSPGWGKIRRSRIGGGERSEPIRRMLIMPYDKESQSRNADFISIARKGNPQPSGPKAPSNLRTFRPIGPVHLKNPLS